MSRVAVLYVYHDRPAMCASRVRLLRALNPGVRLYGICCGRPERRGEFVEVEQALDDTWVCEMGDGAWRWRHMDKVIARWYTVRGKHLPWDVMFEHQADLLLAAPLQTYTDHITTPHDVLFHRTPLSHAELLRANWQWMTEEVDELRAFLRWLRERYGHDGAFCGQSVFFTIFTRAYVEEFAAMIEGVPGVMEYRAPSLARASGYRLVRYDAPQADVACMSFADDGNLSRERVLSEIATAGGARMFHRVFETIEPDAILPMLPAPAGT